MREVQYQHCEKETEGGCEGDIQVWTIEGYDPVPAFVLCNEHAAKFGFCLSCGAFIGGTEDVFLTGQDGLCFDCYMEHERELSIDYYDDDTYDEGWEL